jgi:hypothetical protein
MNPFRFLKKQNSSAKSAPPKRKSAKAKAKTAAKVQTKAEHEHSQRDEQAEYQKILEAFLKDKPQE